MKCFIGRSFKLVGMIGLIMSCQPVFADVKTTGIFGDNNE